MPAHPGTNYHESIWVAVLLPARFIPVLLSTLLSPIFTRLEHRSTPRAIGTTGLKSSNQVLRNPGGSIASISVRLAIPSRARARLERHKSKAPLSSPFQLSVMRKPVQLSVTRTAYALRNNQPVSSRSRQDPSAAVPKWLVCCSEPSAATEQTTCTFQQGMAH